MRGRFNRAARLLRQGPAAFARRLAGSLESYVAYCCAPAEICRRELPSGVAIEKMDDAALRAAVSGHPEMAVHGRVLERMGHNDAYAVRVQGELAHVIWLVPAEHDRQYPVRNLRLRRGEAEITHAVTLPGFRGRGLYAVAIRYLACIAREQGVQRIYMITGRNNLASRSGIEKAGLHRAGRILRVTFDYLGDASITFRGHRFRVPPG